MSWRCLLLLLLLLLLLKALPAMLLPAIAAAQVLPFAATEFHCAKYRERERARESVCQLKREQLKLTTLTHLWPPVHLPRNAIDAASPRDSHAPDGWHPRERDAV